MPNNFLNLSLDTELMVRTNLNRRMSGQTHKRTQETAIVATMSDSPQEGSTKMFQNIQL